MNTMNKQQFGYNLGKLYLKLNTFAKQRSQQYHIPYWVMLLVVYQRSIKTQPKIKKAKG
ncbi:hypothetical protein [Pasteurella multocida]|uniref:hypothetical protein n=1 Tax=Pasteurella multocida TaxID=747 RepID=UPI00159BE2DF|nr:hypothetical protein [Pasteurella multocida]MDY0631416.1 hypothetical protein [Pasteurella multocida]